MVVVNPVVRAQKLAVARIDTWDALHSYQEAFPVNILQEIARIVDVDGSDFMQSPAMPPVIAFTAKLKLAGPNHCHGGRIETLA